MWDAVGSHMGMLWGSSTRTLQAPVLPPSLPPSSFLAHSSCCYMRAAAHRASIPLCPKLLQPLCTSNGPNEASIVSLAQGGCESPQLLPGQDTAP